MLGLILFNVFIQDIFMVIEQSDICNFADDNTLYSCGERLTEIKEKLIFDKKKSILNWFRLNSVRFSDFFEFKFRFHLVHDIWG